jgi:ribosomal protein S18 acetylase RimI-like enzyme
MPVVFFKRYRMQYDLRESLFDAPELPEGFELKPWNESLLASHAEAKFRSFRNELDANVFPCLGESEGCYRLMREIASRQGFVPAATWLATYTDPQTGKIENCGTVQGIREKIDVGSIQNIGIVDAHRGKGIGSAIVRQSLQGFQSVGIKIVTLEVTEKNSGAFRLYERLGFRVLRTVFKSVEIPEVY